MSWLSPLPAAPTPLGIGQAFVEMGQLGAVDHLRIGGPLDQLAAVADMADLPAPDPAARRILRVGKSDGYRLYAWLRQPGADQSFTLTLKLVDRLGRVGRAEVSVPPLPVMLFIAPRLSAITIENLDGGMRLFRWEILSPVVPDLASQYRLRVLIDKFSPFKLDETPLPDSAQVELTLALFIPDTSGIESTALPFPVSIVPGTLQFFVTASMFDLPRVTVTLINPAGQTTAQHA